MFKTYIETCATIGGKMREKAKRDFWKTIGMIIMIYSIILGIVLYYNSISADYNTIFNGNPVLLSAVLLMVFLLGKTFYDANVEK